MAKKSDPNFDLQLLSVLQKLCQRDLTNEQEIEPDPFSKHEKEILLVTDILTACSNKEIRARWCDYVQAFDKQKRPTYIKQSGLTYLELYSLTENYEFALRGLGIVRRAKGLFTEELQGIYQWATMMIQGNFPPFWVRQLLT